MQPELGADDRLARILKVTSCKDCCFDITFRLYINSQNVRECSPHIIYDP
jgi:hypothetical protein